MNILKSRIRHGEIATAVIEILEKRPKLCGFSSVATKAVIERVLMANSGWQDYNYSGTQYGCNYL